jgi:ketosteroid isomerase-like protein
MLLRTAKLMCTMAVAIMFVVSGCAMFKGATDEQLLSELLESWTATMGAHEDVDAVMALYSEDYVGADGSDYQGMSDRLEQFFPFFEQFDVEIDVSEATIEITGDTATIAPVVLSAPQGEMAFTLECKKEGGKWLIVGSEEA